MKCKNCCYEDKVWNFKMIESYISAKDIPEEIKKLPGVGIFTTLGFPMHTTKFICPKCGKEVV